MKLIPIVVAIGVILAGCSTPREKSIANEASQHQYAKLAELGYAVASPVERGNVKLIPIISKSSNPATDDVVTLEVARKNNWVEITESETADFNAVHVKNLGPKPLLLIAGDLVLGGHQDRVVAHDTIIEPGQAMDVEVFCVEKNRSTGPTDVFEPSSQPVPHKVRKEALFAREQSAVWGSVDSFNASAAASPPTNTVQGGLNSREVQDHVAANVDALVERLIEAPNVVGYVLIVDGKIDSAEVFGGNAIFRNAAPQLMRSVLAQAATKWAPSAGADDESRVQQFLYEALTGRRDENRSIGDSDYGNGVNGIVQRRSSNPIGHGRSYRVSGEKTMRGYEVYAAPAKGKKVGALVHGTYAKP